MVRALLWDRSRAPLPIQLTISHEKYSIDAHFLPVPLPRVTYSTTGRSPCTTHYEDPQALEALVVEGRV